MSKGEPIESKRFKIPSKESEEIEAEVHELLGSAYEEVFGDYEISWEVEKIDISDITIDKEFEPHQNAALEERDRAVARAQLTVGESRPLIVMGDDNILIDGHAHLSFLDDLGETTAVVYHAKTESQL